MTSTRTWLAPEKAHGCNAAHVQVDVLSLFPQIAAAAFGESILKRAQESGRITLRSHNIRDWTLDRHRIVDDTPYGGGQGMVLKPEPIFAAVEALRTPGSRVIYMSPCGRRFSQAIAQEFSALPHLILLCGHYEGVDQRVLDHLVDEEISVGDYILTNGAIAAVIVADAVTRLLPGVLGHEQSAAEESFSTGLLEFPHYTRPPEFRGWKVPDILLSGNHAAIKKWRDAEALARTQRLRPDLLG